MPTPAPPKHAIYRYEPGVLYAGAAPLGDPTHAVTVEECWSQCEAASGCGAFQFDNTIDTQNCQMLTNTSGRTKGGRSIKACGILGGDSSDCPNDAQPCLSTASPNECAAPVISGS